MSCPGTGIVYPLSSLVWWQLEQGRASGCTALLSSDQKEQLNFNDTFHTDIKSLMGNRPVILKASHKLTNDLQQYQWFLYQSNETVATTIERLCCICLQAHNVWKPHLDIIQVLSCCCSDEVTIELDWSCMQSMMPMKICNHVDIVGF